MRTVGVAVRWVGHPVTVGATAVLLANDRVGKTAWPGPVTGKLSDVAGLVLFPALLALLVSVLVPRLPARVVCVGALAATGAGFALAKVTAPGNAAATAAWRAAAGAAHVVRDPTDLLALPALALAAWVWRAAARGPDRDAAWTGRVRLFVVLPVALVAVAGTSAVDPPAVTALREDGGRLVVADRGAAYRESDGPRPWVRLDDAAARRLGIDPRLVPSTRTRACLPGEPAHCFRIPGNRWPASDTDDVPRGGRLLWVDETTDAGRTWRRVWQVPPERWRFLAERHGLHRARDDVLLASSDILVRAVPGGYQVVVANGADGLLVRDPSGTWRRVAVTLPDRGTIRPGALTGFGLGATAWLAWAPLAALLGLFVAGLGLALRRAARGSPAERGRRWLALLWPAGPVVAVLPVAFVAAPVASLDIPPGAVFLDVVTGAVLLVAVLVQRDVPRVRALALAGAGTAVAVACVAPYLGWTVGVPAAYQDATRLALWLVAGTVLAAGAVGWWAAGPTGRGTGGLPPAGAVAGRIRPPHP